MRELGAGATIELADISGKGVIRHLWMTTLPTPDALRGIVIRAYWDGQEHPSIEAPLGDFFGIAHGMPSNYASAVHSAGAWAGMNIWLPMPFRTGARFTLTNELDRPVPVFFQLDYTLGDAIDLDSGRLHAFFRRENPTVERSDFELVPRRNGKGRYIGAVIGVRPLSPRWWGEGEIKIYLDGDREFPTIAGTGTEDYVGHSFGLQRNHAPYQGVAWMEGAPGLDDTGRVTVYRWHLADPVYWHEDIRITLQQIGCCLVQPTDRATYLSKSLFERADDVSATSFWYEPVPSDPLPRAATLAERIANLPVVPTPPDGPAGN